MKRILFVAVCMLFTLATAFAQDAKNKKETVTFFVEEMDCQNCIKKIEKGIAFEKGVTDLRCDLSTRTAKVTYKTDKTDCEKLCTAFKKIGLDVVALEDGSEALTGKNTITNTRINTIISKSALYLQSLPLGGLSLSGKINRDSSGKVKSCCEVYSNNYSLLTTHYPQLFPFFRAAF